MVMRSSESYRSSARGGRKERRGGRRGEEAGKSYSVFLPSLLYQEGNEDVGESGKWHKGGKHTILLHRIKKERR